MDELLAILGGVWRQVLLYPGGLTLGCTMLVTNRLWGRTAVALPDDGLGSTALLVQIVGAGVCCAALPWPKTYWAYPIDLFTAVCLLEAPYWLQLHNRWYNVRATVRLATAHEVAALLRVYPLLVLAMTLLAQDAGSLILGPIKQSHGLLHWSGLALWAATFPPLLLLGPWRDAQRVDLSRQLRRVGHIALLAVLALPAGDAVPYSAGAAAAGVTFGSLLVLDHLWKRRARRWEKLQPGLALAALVLLLWTAGHDFGARLR